MTPIHLTKHWPFVETGRIRHARTQLEQTVKQRPEVEALAADLTRRGRENHFSEALERAFKGLK